MIALYIALGLIAVVGGIAFVRGLKAKRACLIRKEEHEKLLKSLRGLRVGILILGDQTNAPHRFQWLFEQALFAHGMVVGHLSENETREWMKTEHTKQDRDLGDFDLAIIGTINSWSKPETIYEYPTRRSIHTETGLPFDELPKSHPDYRSPGSFDIYRDDRYQEPETAFQKRRLTERIGQTVMRQYCDLAVRFITPQQTIGGRDETITGITEMDLRESFAVSASALVENLAVQLAFSEMIWDSFQARRELKT